MGVGSTKGAVFFIYTLNLALFPCNGQNILHSFDLSLMKFIFILVMVGNLVILLFLSRLLEAGICNFLYRRSSTTQYFRLSLYLSVCKFVYHKVRLFLES